MLTREFSPPVFESLTLSLAGATVRICGPDAVLATLDLSLAGVPRMPKSSSTDLAIDVSSSGDLWEIASSTGCRKVLAAESALAQINGAAISSTIKSVASLRNYATMRATVLARDGVAIAFIGDDWESAITLAMHLHGRSWSYVSSDHAVLSPESRELFAVQKSLYINSSMLAHVPIAYRRAIEASPWYVTPHGISFYAVNPAAAGHRHTWVPSAKLGGVIVVDGQSSDRPTMEFVDARTLRLDRFTQFGVDWAEVPAVELCLGDAIETCDLVEHWLCSIRA